MLRVFWVLEIYYFLIYYFLLEDIFVDLQLVLGGSLCEWKGWVCYFDVIVGVQIVIKVVWCYDRFMCFFQVLVGYLVFYFVKMDVCFVGDLLVILQVGDFYGGWFIVNFVGILKGVLGMEYW